MSQGTSGGARAENSVGEVVFRPFQPGDEPQILGLFPQAFPGKRRTLEEWRWRYMENPGGDPTMVLGFHPDGTLIAHYAVLPLRARYLGRPCQMAQPVDAMSHPSYRGVEVGRSGTFLKAARRTFEAFAGAGKVELGFGFPSERHLDLGTRALRYVPLHPPRRWACPLPYQRLPAPASDLVEGRSGDGGTVQRVKKIGPEVDRLWARVQADYPTAVIRDQAYLRWRYQDHPTERYEFFALSDRDGEWLAWVVASRSRTRVLLVDMLLPPTAGEGARDLLAEVLRWASGGKSGWCEGWMPPSGPGREALVRTGFRECAEDRFTTLVARSFVDSVDLKTFGDTFYYQMGDWDMY